MSKQPLFLLGLKRDSQSRGREMCGEMSGEYNNRKEEVVRGEQIAGYKIAGTRCKLQVTEKKRSKKKN